MTLGFSSRFQTVSLRYYAIIAFAFIASLSSIPAEAHANAVKSTNDLGERLFVESGCLFIEEDLLRIEETQFNGTQFDSDHQNAILEYDVFPLERCVTDIAQKIITGIVSSIHPGAADLCFGDSMVDLGILVRNSVEKSTLEQEPYWNYYSSCDRWNVVFNSKPNFTSPSVASNSEENKGVVTAPHQHVIQNLKQLYLSMEFLFIEQLKTQPIASKFYSPATYRFNLYGPLVDAFSLKNSGLFGFWTSLNGRFEVASRILIGLQHASNIGNQFLESSRQSIQH